MFDWFARLARERSGTTAIEFAFLLPVLLMVVLTLTELGRGFMQANAVEKGVRAAALYAARAELPLSADARQVAKNLARTGTMDGSGPLLAPGWADPSADLSIPSPTNFVVDGKNVPVYELTAIVPFEPLFPGMMSMLKLSDAFTMTMTQRQAYVGT